MGELLFLKRDKQIEMQEKTSLVENLEMHSNALTTDDVTKGMSALRIELWTSAAP